MLIEKVLQKPDMIDVTPDTLYLIKNIDNKIEKFYSDKTGANLFSERTPKIFKEYLTYQDLLNETVVDEVKIAYVHDASLDKTVKSGYAFYCFNDTYSTWIKLSEQNLFGIPEINEIVFGIVSTQYIQINFKLRTLNGYSPDGVKINFYYKTLTSIDWILHQSYPYTAGTFEYLNIITPLAIGVYYNFKATITDDLNPDLYIESQTLTKMLPTVVADTDIIAEVSTFKSNLKTYNVQGTDNVVMSIGVHCLNNESTVRIPVIDADVGETFYSFDSLLVQSYPRRFAIGPLSDTTTVYFDGVTFNNGDKVSGYFNSTGYPSYEITVVSETNRLNGNPESSALTYTGMQYTSLEWVNDSDTINTTTALNGVVIVNDDFVYILNGDKGDVSTDLQVKKIPSNGKPINVQNYYFPKILDKAYNGIKSVMVADRHYLIGGYNAATSTYYRNMTYVTVNQNYVFSPTYVNTNPPLIKTDTGLLLPDGLLGHCVFTIGLYVYIIGGQTADIYRATADINGGLSEFTLYSQTFMILKDSQVFVTKNKVYITGGMNSSGIAINKIYYMDILAGDELSPYAEDINVLYEAVYGHRCISLYNRVYLIGGQSSATAFKTRVTTINISSNGQIQSTGSVSPIPRAVSYGFCFVLNNVLCYYGGTNGTGTGLGFIYAPFLWHNTVVNSVYKRQQVTLNPPLTAMPLFFNNLPFPVNIYAGNILTSNPHPEYINTDKTTATIELKAWELVSNLPSPTYKANSISTPLGVYLFPENDSTYKGAAVAKFDLINQTLSNLHPDKKTILTYPIKTFRLMDQLYVIYPMYANMALYRCKINNDGSLGKWFVSSKLPLMQFEGNNYYELSTYNKHSVFVVNNKVYLSSINSPYLLVASFGTDGILSDFDILSLPFSFTLAHNFFVVKNRVYFFIYRSNALMYMNIDSNWRFSEPVLLNELPSQVSDSNLLITSNRIWVIGGVNGLDEPVVDIYKAEIDVNGVIGDWDGNYSFSYPLPKTLNGSSLLVTENYLYLIGGYDKTSTNTSIYRCVFDGWTPVINSGVTDNSLTEMLIPTTTSNSNDQAMWVYNRKLINGKLVSAILNPTEYDLIVKYAVGYSYY